MEDDIPEGYRPDPPGNIEAIWHKSHTPILDLYPYPNNKSPIIPSTSNLDEDWLVAATSRVRLFKTLSSSPNIREYKAEHIQFFFWTALDRSNRRYKDVDAPNAQLWEFHDMHAHEDGLWRDVLLSSPWFDCPIFDDLLHKPQIRNDAGGKKHGKVRMVKRNPHFVELEDEFLERWRFKAAKLKLRRFDNGDAVLPITAQSYRDMYGEKAMEWDIEEEDDESDEETEIATGEDMQREDEDADDEESI
ncbi:hypothetical protein H9Q70_003938 [Fusarium xylarioides]|nr:hypothetical protein H9Q70_003938 [Fusarium xylarioides]KAG5782630.1 hypothetical protein H9Q73_003696 [Fusarium xylarioides]KAG5816606.1 hypothetical protein H9Q71_002281 [Fusarium xylarioides]KAG5827470.1 hypothetical protein H9Q74_002479 [Fusarium xylarioides]